MLTEKRHAGDFLLSEGDGHYSRDNVTLASGQNLQAGTVLGKITSGGKYKVYDQQAGDGSEAAAGILYDNVDASAADTPAVIINRTAEVVAALLIWPDGSPPDVTAGIADLKAIGVIVRS
jgi:hypothetical protein